MILVNIECDKNTTSGKYQIVTRQPHARLLIQEVQYQYNEFINNQLKCAKDPILFVWVEFEHSALHCSFFDVVCDPSVRSQDLLFSHHDMRIKFWWNLCNDIFFLLLQNECPTTCSTNMLFMTVHWVCCLYRRRLPINSPLSYIIYLVFFHSSSFLYLLSTMWSNCRSLISNSTFTISCSWIFEYSTRVPLLVTRPREANLKTSIQIRYRLLLSDGDHVSGSKCDNSF